MLKELTAAALLFVFAGSMIVAADAIIFKKVDVFEMEGEKEKKRDARMELDPDARILSLVDEKKGAEKATYAVIPYDAITTIVYENSAHRRDGQGTSGGTRSVPPDQTDHHGRLTVMAAAT